MIAWRIARSDLERAWAEASVAARGALFFLTVLAALALIGPTLGYEPGADVFPDQRGLGPQLGHPLGTDHLGRDIAWRLLLGANAFVLPGWLAAAVATVVGVGLGTASGWLGGWAASLARWITGSVASLPRFVWVLLVCAAWGDSPVQLAVAVGLAYAPTLAEVVHARLETLRTTEYLLATRAHGIPGWRVLLLHGLLAGCGRRIARHALLCFGYTLVVETTLAYIGGFGVSEPWPSWGNMLAFEWGWSAGAFAPAVALWLAVIAVTVVADSLREAAHG